MYIEKCKACGASINIIHEVNECPYCGTHNSLYQSLEKEKTPSPAVKTSKLKIILVILSLLLAGGIISSIFFFLQFNQQKTVLQDGLTGTDPSSINTYTSSGESTEASSSDVSGNESYVVTVVSKLKVRSGPNLASAVVKVINTNTRLEIIETQDNLETIDNIESRWIKVRISEGESGWIFGGYARNADVGNPPYSVSDFIGTWKCQNCKTGDCSVSLTFNHNRSIQIPADFCSNLPLDIASIKSAIKENRRWLFNNYDATFKFTNETGQILSGVVESGDKRRILHIEQASSLKLIHTDN